LVSVNRIESLLWHSAGCRNGKNKKSVHQLSEIIAKIIICIKIK
jgi:hypothetical protein